MPTGAFLWNDAEVRAALGLAAERRGAPAEFTGVSTDTRKLKAGELYVALTGTTGGRSADNKKDSRRESRFAARLKVPAGREW